MTETPSPSEPATTPVATTEPVAAPVAQEPRRPSRLMQTAAWVGITAGIVFIVAVVFGTGFFLGAHSDGGHRGGGGFHDRPGMMMFHRGGPPPMGQMGPGMFGPGRPDFGGPGTFERPGTPSTTAPERP